MRSRWFIIDKLLYFIGPYLLRKMSSGGWALPARAGSPARITVGQVVEHEETQAKAMRVVVIPVLSDNYSYLLIDDETKQAVAVDPSEAHVVLTAVEREAVRLVGVLTTHKHFDHAGGNSVVASRIPGIKIYGGRLDRVQACTHPLNNNDTIELGSILIRALSTPGHTKGSMSYYCTYRGKSFNNPGLVFTGDTLFVGGCGKLFEGTPEELHASLTEVLGNLPPDTLVYVGHEYAVTNMKFATTIEPTENKALKEMLAYALRSPLSLLSSLSL